MSSQDINAPALPKPDLVVFDAALQSPVEGLTMSKVREFVAVAVQAERDACAQLCIKFSQALDHGGNTYVRSRECVNAANAIRQRSYP